MKKHGNVVHGMCFTRPYRIWKGMKERCFRVNHPAYKNYGARGITVCQRWLSFANFYADMGEPPRDRCLERINNDGDYEPANCRWATILEQHRNTRRNKLTLSDVKTIRVFLRYDVSHSKLARIYGVNQSHISRIGSGETWE